MFQDARPMKQEDPSFNYELYYLDPADIKKDLPNIPQPYFLSSIFPEVDIAICRPLDYPFDHYSITHYGLCFYSKDIKVQYFPELNSYFIDSTSVLYETIIKGRSFISIPDKFGVPHMFDVDQLVVNRFFNIPLNTKTKVIHLDGSLYNHHYMNLEVVED